jgi:hypothetical protein
MNVRLLHIGMPKSGSTYLQKKLFSYAEDTRVVSHFSIEDHLCELIIQQANAWIQKRLDCRHHFIEGKSDLPNWDTYRISHELQNLGTKDLILSSEYLLGNDRFFNMDLSDCLWNDLKQMINPTFVLVIVRRQDSFLRSLYLNHYRQNSWRMRFDHFLSIINQQALDYYQLYLKLTSIYPKDMVLFLPAELLFRDEQQFVDILSHRSGIQFSSLEREKMSEKLNARNLAMSQMARMILGMSSLFQRKEILGLENRLLRELHRKYNLFFVNLSRWVDRKIFGTCFYKEVEVDQSDVLSIYYDSNRELNKVIKDVDLRKYGYF